MFQFDTKRVDFFSYIYFAFGFHFFKIRNTMTKMMTMMVMVGADTNQTQSISYILFELEYFSAENAILKYQKHGM